ncbi:hypothetical protein G7054_g5728 [Neopestalotiopsis clavispora]|nr:hypothetical protein G7054_g5728 [Neopestalotiopsis clavispora]
MKTFKSMLFNKTGRSESALITKSVEADSLSPLASIGPAEALTTTGDAAAGHKRIFDTRLRIRYEVAGPAYVHTSLAAGSSDLAKPIHEPAMEAC